MEDLRLELRVPTSPEWVSLAIEKFDEFLVDHAACERKASATAMMFVMRYPERHELVEAMVQLSREELMHFHQVWRLLRKRGQTLAGDKKNEYMNHLLQHTTSIADEGDLLDRLLIFGIVEARGHERFALIGQHHPDPVLKDFYTSLAEAESRHHQLFIDFSLRFFSRERVEKRLSELLEVEAAYIKKLPPRPAVH